MDEVLHRWGCVKENKIVFLAIQCEAMENSAASYKLYGIPYLGSMAIELLMEEGIKYDIVFPTPEGEKL